MSRETAEFHANQREKGSGTTLYQEVPGKRGRHWVRIIEQSKDNESNVRWRASEWHAKVSSG